MAKPYWKTCKRGRMLRAVMAEALPQNVVFIRKASEQEARLRLIDATKAYCLARCGGCPLTEECAAPERISTGP